MKKTLVITLMMVALAGAGRAYVEHVETHHLPEVFTAAVTTGDIVEMVKGTGTLTPLRSVDVGTQVSGIVRHLYVDFNSIVKNGQVLAELDPALFQTALDSAHAMVDQAQIALDEERQQLLNDRRILERTQALLDDHVAMQQDLDTAAVTVKQDEAMVGSDQAALATAQAGVRQAEVNLSHCTIYSPIDGVVISRDVDEGQAVAAQMSAPSIYMLGTDLQSLQLIGDIDESDVGRLRPGQQVTFTVDAYPTARFHGSLAVVRLNSTTINNVVTYQAVITVPNRDLRLLPGMTANLTIETSRSEHTLRVPNSALRFRPTPGAFTAFGQKSPAAAASKAPASAPATADVTTAITDWRIKPPSTTGGVRAALAKAGDAKHSTIDWFFEPLPKTEHPADVWVVENQKLVDVPLEIGITDGTWTQVLGGEVRSGEEFVSNVVAPAAPRTH